MMQAAPAEGTKTKKEMSAAVRHTTLELRVRAILIARGIYRVHPMAQEAFEVASASSEPIIVRPHRSKHG